MNVSVMGGFAYADTAKNGLSVIVTARTATRDAQRAKSSPARSRNTAGTTAPASIRS